jgi:hypothetical protein
MWSIWHDFWGIQVYMGIYFNLLIYLFTYHIIIPLKHIFKALLRLLTNIGFLLITPIRKLQPFLTSHLNHKSPHNRFKIGTIKSFDRVSYCTPLSLLANITKRIQLRGPGSMNKERPRLTNVFRGHFRALVIVVMRNKISNRVSL